MGGREGAAKLAKGKGTSLWVRQTYVMSPHPCPNAVTVPSYKTPFTPKKILQMESEVRLASSRYHWKDQAGGKKGLFKLL